MPPLSYTSTSILFTIVLITSLLIELVSAVKTVLLIHYLTNAYIVIGCFHQLTTCLLSTSTEAIPPRERALLHLLFQVSPHLPSYNTSSQDNYPLPPPWSSRRTRREMSPTFSPPVFPPPSLTRSSSTESITTQTPKIEDGQNSTTSPTPLSLLLLPQTLLRKLHSMIKPKSKPPSITS